VRSLAALRFGLNYIAWPCNVNRHQDEFEPTVGTWNYTVGDANYQVVFSHYNSNVIN